MYLTTLVMVSAAASAAAVTHTRSTRTTRDHRATGMLVAALLILLGAWVLTVTLHVDV